MNITGTPRILEVIACSLADAIAARDGGADRLEIVRDLKRGGLTPSLELVQEIKAAVDLPLRVMLRESESFAVSGAEEIEHLCRDAEHLAAIGVDGLVLGFLKDAHVDVALTQRVLALAPMMKATFHHAFEAANDKLLALKQIKTIAQVDRILSSGGVGDLSARVQRLRLYEQHSSPEITILAGGVVDADAILEIGRTTGIREFHVGRAARHLFRTDGAVDATLVSRVKDSVRNF
jgi:copper homeostasis protein